MIRNIIRTAVAVLSRTAYEDGRRDGAGLVPRRELEEAKAYARGVCEKRDEWQARAEKAEAALNAAKADFAASTKAMTETVAGLRESGPSVDKLVSAVKAASQPAAYPWSDEAVERAVEAFMDCADDTAASMRAALATLAPPPQAAPVPPVGVGDVWGDAVRVTKDDADYVVMVGRCIVDRYTSGGYANAVAEDIRRGLASLPPLRAVLVGGVTEGMVEAFDDAKELVSRPLTGTPGDATRAGLTAALAAANIRVLGPGEGVVRVRVRGDEEHIGGTIVYRSDRTWGDLHMAPGTRYILAADLDAAAAGVGKGVES